MDTNALLKHLNKLDPHKIHQILEIADKVKDPSELTTENINKLASLANIPTIPPTTNSNPQSKVGRNKPCPCNSGKKWKKCCGIL